MSFSAPTLIAAAHLRRTRTTLAVVELFLTQQCQLFSHADLVQALQQSGEQPDRVTLYRLLERLTQAEVLVRQVDAQRVTRFSLSARYSTSTIGPEVEASRFECNACHRHYRLDEVFQTSQKWAQAAQGVQQALAALADCGATQVAALDISVRGLCATCVEPERA